MLCDAVVRSLLNFKKVIYCYILDTCADAFSCYVSAVRFCTRSGHSLLFYWLSYSSEFLCSTFPLQFLSFLIFFLTYSSFGSLSCAIASILRVFLPFFLALFLIGHFLLFSGGILFEGKCLGSSKYEYSTSEYFNVIRFEVTWFNRITVNGLYISQIGSYHALTATY